MPTLFFMPWVPCTQEIAIGPAKLVPYSRGKQPGSLAGIAQEDIDAILGAYAVPTYLGSSTDIRIERATIMWWDGDSSSTELTDDDIATRLAFGQTIVFAALSERRFGSYWYWNADSLAMIAQRFGVGEASRLTIRTRRRDGFSLNMVSASGTPVFLRPKHVSGDRVEFDEHLVVAINNLNDGAFKDRILNSITVFNRANTDSQDVSLATELVLLRVAFETLFQATHETTHLQRRIAAHFNAFRPRVAWASGPISEAIWRARWPKNVHRPLDAWVQDFCAARNSAAHGITATSRHAPLVWSNSNHALFASALFPLCVKSMLNEVGAFSLTDMDRDYLINCEGFLAHDVFALTADGKLTWDLVDEQIRRRELNRRISAGLEKHCLT